MKTIGARSAVSLRLVLGLSIAVRAQTKQGNCAGELVSGRGALARVVDDGAVENVYRIPIMIRTEARQPYQVAARGIEGLEVSEAKASADAAALPSMTVSRPKASAQAFAGKSVPMILKFVYRSLPLGSTRRPSRSRSRRFSFRDDPNSLGATSDLSRAQYWLTASSYGQVAQPLNDIAGPSCISSDRSTLRASIPAPLGTNRWHESASILRQGMENLDAHRGTEVDGKVPEKARLRQRRMTLRNCLYRRHAHCTNRFVS